MKLGRQIAHGLEMDKANVRVGKRGRVRMSRTRVRVSYESRFGFGQGKLDLLFR